MCHTQQSICSNYYFITLQRGYFNHVLGTFIFLKLVRDKTPLLK